MADQINLLDNNGHVVPPGCAAADPIDGSGQTLTDSTTGADHTVTVVAGAMYAFTCLIAGGMIFGLATTATAANIIWACGFNETIIIKIPEGYTTLHYQSPTSGGSGYLRRIK
ncbi:MAG: hypothetical protein IMZ53_02865 [Thermoplasmata archaeon]|nr:hypothetical protein [Thermoplasmata archaeon]